MPHPLDHPSKMSQLLTTLSLSWVIILTLANEKFDFFTKVANIENNIVSRPPMVSKITAKGTCVMACMSDPMCNSFFHSNVTGRCTTHSVVFKPTQVTVPEPGPIYYVRIPTTCPLSSGFIYVGWLSMCYRLYTEPFRNQSESKMMCPRDGGHLANVDNLDKEQYLSGLLDFTSPGQAYVQGECKNGGSMANDWKLDDGSPVVHVTWNRGEPNGNCDENCMVLTSIRFNDLTCNRLGAAFCELNL